MIIARLAVALSFFAAPVVAQQGAATSIPIRQVAPSDGASKELLRSIDGLVQFADGHVLVNDMKGKRLVLFDASLSNFSVTADSNGSGSTLYPNSYYPTGLYYFLGDSAAFTDMPTQTFTIVGPDGKLGRSMALPRPNDLLVIDQPLYTGTPAFDPVGRFVYRAPQLASDIRPAPGQPAPPPHTADTGRVVRADFDARNVDTIATVFLPIPPAAVVTRHPDGSRSSKMIINPVPSAPDGWSLLSDGSLAVLRAHDYHIDWVYLDGKTASTPKMPFAWRRLTDDDKRAKIDSMKHLIDSLKSAGRPYGMIVTVRNGQRANIVPTYEFLPIDQVADYVPAIRDGALKSDRDDHLWILPTTTLGAVGGGLLYDVVNTKGEIFERVQLPAGRTIAGFGRGGVIYLSSGDRTKGFTLEKTHVIR